MKNRVYLLIAIIPFFLLQTRTVSAWQLNITPQFRVGEEFNDNIYLTNDNEQEDYITRASLGLTSEAKTKNSAIQASYFALYSFYGRSPDLNNLSHRANLGLESNLNKHTTFKLLDEFAYTQDPYYTSDINRTEFKGIPKVDYTIRQDRETYMINTTSATLAYQTMGKHTIEAGYLYGILRNDDEIIEDSQRQRASLDGTYILSQHSDTSASATYTHGDFQITEDLDEFDGHLQYTQKLTPKLDARLDYRHAVFNFEGEKTGYQVYEPSIGMDYSLGKQTDLSIDVGYFYKDSGSAGSESDATGTIDFSHSFERGSISLIGSTGWMPTYFGAENLGFTLTYNAGIRFAYQLSQELFFNTSAGYNRAEYTEEDRIDDTISANLGFGYVPSVWKWLMFNISYTFRNVDSTAPDDNYTNNRVLLGVTLTPQRPYKWNF